MPLTTTTGFVEFAEGDKARASEVKDRDAWGAEGHHWPHSGGSVVDDSFDLGQETGHWRYGWFRALNPTSTARPITVGTTTSANDSSTAFEIAGSRAFIVPRMTSAQRTALTGVNGMVVYDSTIERMQVYEDGGWVSLGQPIQQVLQTETSAFINASGTSMVNTTTNVTIASVTTAKAFVNINGMEIIQGAANPGKVNAYAKAKLTSSTNVEIDWSVLTDVGGTLTAALAFTVVEYT